MVTTNYNCCSYQYYKIFNVLFNFCPNLSGSTFDILTHSFSFKSTVYFRYMFCFIAFVFIKSVAHFILNNNNYYNNSNIINNNNKKSLVRFFRRICKCL